MAVLDAPVTLFGGYVERASLSVGYGSQSSTCQLTLVYENDGPGNNVDFSLNFPEEGTCVGFVFGELEFAGIFQKWSESKSLDGYRYEIVLESPSKVLDGVQVILDSFQGSAYPRIGVFENQIHNVWNVFAYMENYAYGGIFGGSNVNSAGMPGLGTLELMESASRNEISFGGKITYGASEYTLDLSELKQVLYTLPNWGVYRIKGPVQSVSSILEEACNLIMYDYIVEVEPASGSITNGIIVDPVIKIRMVDKSRPPDLSLIRNAIKRFEQAGELISSDFGRELSNTVTQKLVIGGPATRYVFFEPSSMTQLWGKTKGNMPTYCRKIVLDDGRQYPSEDTQVDVMEVRAAMHSFDSWVLWHVIRRQLEVPNAIIDEYASYLFTNVTINEFVLNRIGTGKITAMDLIDSSLASAQKRNQVTVGGYVYEELQKIHNAIKSAGEEYWGRKYAITLPIEPGGIFNNLKFTTEDFQYINSWEMADSAWHEVPAPFQDVSFFDGEGKLKPTATWKYDPANYDYTQLGSGYCFGTKGGISSVVNVEKDIYWNAVGVSTATCVVDLPPVAIFDQYTTEHNGLFHFLQMYYGYTNEQLSKIAGFGWEAGSTLYGIAPARATPQGLGLPQVSTRFRWGPWWNYKTLTGAAEVILEESLTPETFGGIDIMSEYGIQYAAVANAEVGGVESGSLELAGAPIGNIGRRFLIAGPYTTGMDISIGIGGVTTNYKFNTWTPQFGKLSKYNADRFANARKNAMGLAQSYRDKIKKREFVPQKYKDKPNKYARPLNLGMAGFNMISGMLGNAGGAVAAPRPGDATPAVDSQPVVHGGVVTNQVGPIAQDPENAYACSAEQIFSPVYSAKKFDSADVGAKPCFREPKDTNYVVNGTPIGPNSENLNPYFSLSNNDFTNVVMDKGQNQDLNWKKAATPPSSVQTMGFKGPLMLSGWGYGLDMKAMPFKTTDATLATFDDSTATNRKIWKTGPIDLRWDEERKVWGGGFDFVEGYLTSDMSAASNTPSTFTVSVYRNKDTDIETDGLNTDLTKVKWRSTTKSITGINRSRVLSTSSGAYVILIRINYEWRPIYVDC